jgi:hypothetical protein
MPRTVESLQQVIHGLYPMSKCEPLISHRVLVRCAHALSAPAPHVSR